MKRLLIILTALFLVSCAASSSFVMLGEKRIPTQVSEIKVYHKEPTMPYQEIAKIQASTSTGFTEQSRQERIINEVVERAAELGANAVIFEESFKTPQLFSNAYVTIKGKAVYIP